MLLKILIIFLPTFICIVNGLFRPTSIPRDVRLTKINESMSQWLASTCGRSTEGLFDAKKGHLKGRRYPWAVSIMLFGKNKLGGSIISPYHILTAAHGFVKLNGFHTVPCQIIGYRNEEEIQKRVVAIGGDCIRGRSRFLPNHSECNHATATFNRIRVVYVDSDFASTGCIGGHDWAIVELENPLTFDASIQPICLPFYNQPINPIFTVYSWGKRDIFSESDPIIHEIIMAHDPKCRPPWSDTMPSKLSDYICGKSLNPRNPTSLRTCHGDSGSGLEQRDSFDVATLIGITSFGSKGCPANELARFTRVSSYLNSICELTGVCYTIK